MKRVVLVLMAMLAAEQAEANEVAWWYLVVWRESVTPTKDTVRRVELYMTKHACEFEALAYRPRAFVNLPGKFVGFIPVKPTKWSNRVACLPAR